MTEKRYLKKLLIIAFLLVTVGGLIIHTGIHSLKANPSNYVPFIIGLLSVFVLTFLFSFSKTVPYAYILNGMMVIIGTITMVHFSLHRLLLKPPLTLTGLIFHSLLGDTIILWTSLFIGKLILELDLTTTVNFEKEKHKGRFFRYPNFGYWVVHLVSLSAVYALGHILWK